MPVLSAQAYDSLLLEKVKLVIQAVLQDPKTPHTTFEDFVVGFDVAQPLAYKLFDLLIQETTKRRPRKVNAETSTSASTSSSGANAFPPVRRTRTARAHSPDPIDMLTTRPQRMLRLADAMANGDEGGGARLMDTGSSRHRRLAGQSDSLATGRMGANANDNDVSPSTRLRQRQLEELFGPSRAGAASDGDAIPGDLLDLLDEVDDDLDTNDGDNAPRRVARRSSAAARPFMPTTNPLALVYGDNMPSYRELWSLLVDDPFPTGGVSSYFSFRIMLNGTQAFAGAPVRASSFEDLLDELADRDLAFPIRLSNLLAARNRDGLGASNGGLLSGAQAQTGTDEAPAEGIWRASFVEHLDDGTTREVPVSLGTIGRGGGQDVAGNDGPGFAAFAERRRAERRARTRGSASVDSNSTGAAGSEAMNVDSPATSASTSGEAPVVTISHASTPATSAAHSPAPSTSLGAALAELCPPFPRPTATAAAVAPTSASLAEAHFRSQRTIAPLPSHRAVSPDGAAAASLRTQALPDGMLTRIRDCVEAGELDYDPATGWSGSGLQQFTPEQLNAVAQSLTELRHLYIRGSEQSGIEIEF
ncbi:hypothetical protein JCM10908_002847 [Rhodotorula pacifica]|uniref:uncharacterized protein n=1 Tax=Rhodotorula pacifica TaxID=1495444 RepID=UPI00318058BF